MIVVCQQLNYFSWLGYFEQCARSDQLVILDSVQFIKRGLQNRTKILPHSGDITKKTGENFQWLTIPLKTQGHREKKFYEIEIDTSDNWSKRHWNTLYHVYGKRPLFKEQFEPLLRPWFEQAGQFKTLFETLDSSLALCLSTLDLHPQINFSSKLEVAPQEKSKRIISLCQSVGASSYYSGIGSANYLDTQAFREAAIELRWQRWKHTEYEQGRECFRSHLSILDALANVPVSEIKSWLSIKN